MDYVNEYNKDDNYEYVMRSGAWPGALLSRRFKPLGLGGGNHAVLQIGGGDGLLLGACTEV